MGLPTVTVQGRAIGRLRGGYPWIYREEVVHPPDGPGDVARVVDGKGRLAGSALWSPGSRIVLRLFSREETELDERLLDERIGAALGRRRALFPEADAFRVVHGEADLIPGLLLDVYGDVAALQTTCAAMDRREPALARLAAARLGTRLVVARDDGAVRDADRLARRKGVAWGRGSARVEFHDAGIRLTADVLEDGKTGGYLDQQENHARAATYVRGAPAALDAFTYHGGFALSLARAGAAVTALDESPAAIERARQNAAQNRLAIDLRVANAFDALREMEAGRRRFDIVVLDPPALAKRSGSLATAERAYKELNLRALRLLTPGGLLVTCSCSGKLTGERFDRVIESAARDVGRPLQLVERRGASRDHPVLVTVPETDYLKCRILRVLA